MKNKLTWKIGAALALCPLAMWLFSLTLPKRYTATMMLLVDQTIRVASARADDPLTDMTNFSRARSVATQIDMITGSDVLLRAIELTSQKHPGSFADGDRAQERYQSLVNRLRVDVNRDSEVIQLRVTMDNPVLAADTANNIGEAYIQKTREIAAQTGNAATMTLSEKITKDEARLAELEKQIKQVKMETGVTDAAFGSQMIEKVRTDMELQVAQADAEHNGAVAELQAARTFLSGTPKYLTTNTSTDVNPEIFNIEAQITRLEAELAAARERFTDNNPRVRELANSVATLKERRRRMSATIKGHENVTLNPNYTTAQNAVAMAEAKVGNTAQRLARFRGELAAQRAKVASYPEAERRLSQLALERDALKMTHAQNLQKRAALEMTGAGRESQARIISTAYPPSRPSFPNTRLFVLMGLAVGIVISALIVMPKAPEIVYTPVPAEALTLNGSTRAEAALPNVTEREAQPAIGQGGQT